MNNMIKVNIPCTIRKTEMERHAPRCGPCGTCPVYGAGFFTSLISLVMLDPYIHTAHGEHSKLGWEVKKKDADLRKVVGNWLGIWCFRSQALPIVRSCLHPDAPVTSSPMKMAAWLDSHHRCSLNSLRTAEQTMASFGSEVCLNHLCLGFPSHRLGVTEDRHENGDKPSICCFPMVFKL